MNDSEQELHGQVIRAEKARLLLESDLLKEALDSIEKEVVTAWGNTPARDKEGKEQLWQLYKTAQKFRGLLIGYIETGRLAQSRLDTFKSLMRKVTS